MATELQKMKDLEVQAEKSPDPLLSVHSFKQRLQNPPSVSSNHPPAKLPSTLPEDQTAQEPKMEGEEQKESKRLNEETMLSSSSVPVTDLQKKFRRAERFGMPVLLSEEEKRSSRAERFGMQSISHGSEEMKKSEEEKRKARAERFGLSTNSTADEEAKKKARLDRFATAAKPDTAEEDKKKARAIRFSQTSKSGPSQVNGEAEAQLVTSAVPR